MCVGMLQDLNANVALVLDPSSTVAAAIRGRCRMATKDYGGAVTDLSLANDPDTKYHEEVTYTLRSSHDMGNFYAVSRAAKTV